GLIGAFWQIEKPYYTFTLFASPFFVPDQGPSFAIKDGSFVKGNPWFRQPPESIRIWNEATAIDYNLEQPNESQIVLHNSFALKLAFGDVQGLHGQVAYSYKPSNQLAIGYEGYLNTTELRGAVNLQPQVFYHSLGGLDLAYRYHNWKWGVSGMWDRPTREEIFEEKWTHPVFEEAVLVSPFMEWNNGRWGVSLQHMEIFNGDVHEEGDLASDDRAPLMTRYPYRQAQQVALMYSGSFAKTRRWTGKVSYTHSQKNDFDLIRISSRLTLSRWWALMAEAQLVKAGELSVENQNEIAQYVNNDRLMAGVAYVF
ncbi:MAG: hypothetical protein AAGB31_16740, partial [Bdellovibrio sp.]